LDAAALVGGSGDAGCDQLLPDLVLVDDLDAVFLGFGEFAGPDVGAGDE
jgi:hypothetical protein